MRRRVGAFATNLKSLKAQWERKVQLIIVSLA